MPTLYLELLGHIVVADSGLQKSAELSQLLVKGGLPKAETKIAHDLADAAIHAVEARLAQHEDRIQEHALHIAVTEVEMWMQTVRYLLKKELTDDVIAVSMGASIHSSDHAVSVAAQALRLISTMRCDDRVRDAIGDAKKTHDMATRGWSLLKKLYRVFEQRLEAVADEDPGVFKDLETQERAMHEWLTKIDQASGVVVEKHVSLLGLLGYIPEGVAHPVGGSSSAVTLHERGQGAPPGAAVRPCSGWSIGRQQGRNRENLGKGWVEPTFE